jgi:ubiquinol-cytochrome c reductase cytochrome b subunit
VLFLFTIYSRTLLFSGFNFSPIARFLFWTFISNFILLTWLGSCPAESPYNEVALGCTFFYFILVFIMVSWNHVITYLYLNK